MIIRRATPGDLADYAAIVEAAYAPYVPRMGRKPAPMLDDHAARVRDGEAWVAEVGGAVAGIAVLIDAPDHLLLDNIAVAAGHRRTGVGRALLGFAEAEAVRRGQPEVRLYTNETMVENIALYGRIGYVEVSRTLQKGFKRVFFRKPVAQSRTMEIPG